MGGRGFPIGTFLVSPKSGITNFQISKHDPLFHPHLGSFTHHCEYVSSLVGNILSEYRMDIFSSKSTSQMSICYSERLTALVSFPTRNVPVEMLTVHQALFDLV